MGRSTELGEAFYEGVERRFRRRIDRAQRDVSDDHREADRQSSKRRFRRQTDDRQSSERR